MPDSVYCYPGTDILRNKLDIHDADLLKKAERDLTARRLLQLQHHPVIGHFDYQHLKSIHHYIFQDLYDWAGKQRTVDIAKSNMFCNVLYLDNQAWKIFNALKSENLLIGLSRDDFINRLVWYLGEVNALHPFREGNGRTQREYFRELALHAGYIIDYTAITRNEMIDASIDSFMCKYDKLTKLFNEAITINKV
ncbi:MAG: Fic family protein [Eubacterium sp.]|nr:Fic family protein [Eubacterium sp.]MCH4110211.1 Fic family protein [Eubacterium sp.]MCI1308018.1 Fic family protein [Eubacterium sp.]MCI1406489.1 Fic family protein [Eubacterium sp.]MCI1428706.1 Fic family protein [Eubacterium sp.]